VVWQRGRGAIRGRVGVLGPEGRPGESAELEGLAADRPALVVAAKEEEPAVGGSHGGDPRAW